MIDLQTRTNALETRTNALAIALEIDGVECSKTLGGNNVFTFDKKLHHFGLVVEQLKHPQDPGLFIVRTFNSSGEISQPESTKGASLKGFRIGDFLDKPCNPNDQKAIVTAQELSELLKSLATIDLSGIAKKCICNKLGLDVPLNDTDSLSLNFANRMLPSAAHSEYISFQAETSTPVNDDDLLDAVKSYFIDQGFEASVDPIFTNTTLIRGFEGGFAINASADKMFGNSHYLIQVNLNPYGRHSETRREPVVSEHQNPLGESVSGTTTLPESESPISLPFGQYLIELHEAETKLLSIPKGSPPDTFDQAVALFVNDFVLNGTDSSIVDSSNKYSKLQSSISRLIQDDSIRASFMDVITVIGSKGFINDQVNLIATIGRFKDQLPDVESFLQDVAGNRIMPSMPFFLGVGSTSPAMTARKLLSSEKQPSTTLTTQEQDRNEV